jgi:TonB family protein
MRRTVVIGGAALSLACIDQSGAQRAIDAMLPSGARPEVMPRMLNTPSPFVYPRTLFDARTTGDVLLRLWIDTSGTPRHDSTKVQEHATQAAFDSAAVAGAGALRFSPAMQGGHPVAVSVLLPVQFRLPPELPKKP